MFEEEYEEFVDPFEEEFDDYQLIEELAFDDEIFNADGSLTHIRCSVCGSTISVTLENVDEYFGEIFVESDGLYAICLECAHDLSLSIEKDELDIIRKESKNEWEF
jgi:hypothetical protein